MTAPDISVIIPCFNAERWISFAVDSALAQEGVSVEVIVVDDGSTDSSGHILESYSSRVTVIRKANGGVSSARNAGIRQASGNYIRFLDADDIIPKNSIARAYRIAQQSPGDIVVGRTNVISPDGQIMDSGAYNLPLSVAEGEKIDALYLLTQATSSSMWLIPRDVFGPDMHFSESINLGEEYQFSRKLISFGCSFLSSVDIFSTIRQHNGERLSRQGKEVDFLRQLEEIRLNAEYILKHLAGKRHPSTLILARQAWIRGRDCARAGYILAARRHFEFALGLEGQKAVGGHSIYRMLTRCIGPLAAERAISMAKRVTF